jgi:hypothetical protein
MAAALAYFKILSQNLRLYQNKWLDHLEQMDTTRLPKLAFQYQLQEWWDMKNQDEETKNTLSFKGTGLKT